MVMSLNVLSLSFRVQGLSRLVLQATRSPNTASPTSKCWNGIIWRHGEGFVASDAYFFTGVLAIFRHLWCDFVFWDRLSALFVHLTVLDVPSM